MSTSLIFGKVFSTDLSSSWRIRKEKDQISLLTGKSRILFKRMPHPSLFLKKSKNKIEFGYRGEIEFILKKGYLVLESGTTSTVPLFYHSDGKKIVFSNNYINLLFHLSKPTTLNLPFVAEYLLLSWYYRKDTFLNNVFLLTERSQAVWDGKELILEEPKEKGSPKSPRLRKKILVREEALTRFDKLLDQIISQKLRKLKGFSIGVELSGGLDSSIVAASLARKIKQPLETFSMILPGRQSKDQIKRLEDFKKRFNCRLNLVKTDDLYPLKDKGQERGLRFYPMEEVYREALKQLANLARKKRIEVIFTGVGGDELFESDPGEEGGFYGEKELEERKRRKISSFFTPKIKKAFLAKDYVLIRRAVPLVPYSVLSAGHARNNLYIREGIWPIAILGDLNLVNFSRNLPEELKQNKNLFRLYHQKYKLPNSFISLRKKDTFFPLLEIGIKNKEKPFLINLFKNSELEKLSLVDGKKLVQSYKSYTEERGSEENFYGLATLELFLRAIKKLDLI